MAPVGNEAILRPLLIVDQWFERLGELDLTGRDPAHRNRLDALEDAVQRMIVGVQSYAPSVRRGPVLGLRAAASRLSDDMVDPQDQQSQGETHDPEFEERERARGTVSAILADIERCLGEVEDALVGPAREMSVPTHIPDEVICIPQVLAMTWTKRAINLLSDIQHSLGEEHLKDRRNTAIIRDIWVCLHSASAAMVQVADAAAVDARSFLGHLIDASSAASRVLQSLERRGSIAGAPDPLSEHVNDPLKELKVLVDEGTDLVLVGLTNREGDDVRIAWRFISKGAVELDDDKLRQQVTENMPAANRDRLEAIVEAGRRAREDWRQVARSA